MKIHGKLDGDDIYGIAYVIRYGPALIFSNQIPGLDANFINPKYTKANPYEVRSLAKYSENYEYTSGLKKGLKGKIKNIDDLINRIRDVDDKCPSSNDAIYVNLIADTYYDNETVLQIYFDDETGGTGSHMIEIYRTSDSLQQHISALINGEENPDLIKYDNEGKSIKGVTLKIFKEILEGSDPEGKGYSTSKKNWDKYVNDKLIANRNESETNWFTMKGNLVELSDGTDTTAITADEARKVETKFREQYGCEDDVSTTWEYNGNIYELKTEEVNLTHVVSETLYNVTLYSVGRGTALTGETKVSTSYQLVKKISKWYTTLRTIALVGLLSVLVYVGIRIIISSTGQEKAKYKKMIGDWLVAICILFILNYIMAFTMKMVEEISDIFSSNLVGESGEDVLMSEIRSKINEAGAFSGQLTELLIYLVLVIYTVIFTIHYLKRLVYLAFFTMIAPLIALTYPLDKIKDGQAQAFSMWVKEYVFNALIPIIHLLLYYIFVGSAMEFAESNPIYALVCIGFMIPAEKFIRKMFGFDRASTSSQLGAAAGGAMVMNAINKISQAPKGETPAQGKPPRTSGVGGSTWNGPTGSQQTAPTLASASNTGGQASRGNVQPGNVNAQPGNAQPGNAQPGNVQPGNAQPGNVQPGNAQPGNAQPGNAQPGNVQPGNVNVQPGNTQAVNAQPGNVQPGNVNAQPGNAQPGNTQAQEDISQEADTTQNKLYDPDSIKQVRNNDNSQIEFSERLKNVGNGVKEAFGDRFNRKTIKGFAKKAGKKATRAGGKALGAAALLPFGLAAGIATGDLSNVTKYSAAAGAVGAKMGARGVDRGTKIEKRTRDAFQRGRLGGDEFNERKTVREVREDRDFTKACRAAGITNGEEEDLIKQFVQNGVTDKEEIIKAMVARKNYEKSHGITKGNRNSDDKKNFKITNEKMIAMAKLNQGISDSSWGNPEIRNKILDRIYAECGDKEEVQRVEALVSGMKG